MPQSPLELEIRKRIRLAGPMPVRQFMTLCLTHPDYGYYTTRDPLGSGGVGTVFRAQVLQGRLPNSAPRLDCETLAELAPSEKLQELKKSVAEDMEVDAAAIQAWRGS